MKHMINKNNIEADIDMAENKLNNVLKEQGMVIKLFTVFENEHVIIKAPCVIKKMINSIYEPDSLIAMGMEMVCNTLRMVICKCCGKVHQININESEYSEIQTCDKCGTLFNIDI